MNTAHQAMQFAIAHPAEVQWLGDHAEHNDFAASLARYLNDHGTLTPNQLEAVTKKVAAANAATFAPVVNVAEIAERFAVAIANQIKKPAMRLDTFVFKYAGDAGRNPGAIYVTRADDKSYLGKVAGGKFLRSQECNDEQEARIVAAASDPAAAAKAYGQRTGCCSVCGRTLTASESIDAFIGPVCRQKYGLIS